MIAGIAATKADLTEWVYEQGLAALLIVVSDHGFSLHRGGYDHYHIPESFPAPSGIFVMKGPGAKPGLVPSVSIYDIAPTILHLFDLPVGENMDGGAVTAALTWERDTGSTRYARALGYIQ